MKKYLLLAVCVLLAGSAWGQKTKFISHRGESLDAPENTMAAFKLALSRDTDGFECDLHLTKDKKIIVSHDYHTERMTGQKRVIADHTANELRQLDAGFRRQPEFAGEKLPLFSEVLSLVRKGRMIYAEIKCGVEIIPFLKEELKRNNVKPSELLFITFHREVVKALRREFPDFKTYWLVMPEVRNNVMEPGFDEILASLKALDASGLDIMDMPEIDRNFVEKVKKAGFEFHVWTIDDPVMARKYIELNVDSITSNRAAFLKNALREIE